MSYYPMSGFGAYEVGSMRPVLPVFAGFGATMAGSFDLDTTLGVQKALNVLGASPRLEEDGKPARSGDTLNFPPGTKTYDAVVAFQKSKGLTADGIVGKDTKAALVAALAGSGQRIRSGMFSGGNGLLIAGGVLFVGALAFALSKKRK